MLIIHFKSLGLNLSPSAAQQFNNFNLVFQEGPLLSALHLSQLFLEVRLMSLFSYAYCVVITTS